MSKYTPCSLDYQWVPVEVVVWLASRSWVTGYSDSLIVILKILLFIRHNLDQDIRKCHDDVVDVR